MLDDCVDWKLDVLVLWGEVSQSEEGVSHTARAKRGIWSTIMVIW